MQLTHEIIMLIVRFKRNTNTCTHTKRMIIKTLKTMCFFVHVCLGEKERKINPTYNNNTNKNEQTIITSNFIVCRTEIKQNKQKKTNEKNPNEGKTAKTKEFLLEDSHEYDHFLDDASNYSIFLSIIIDYIILY